MQCNPHERAAASKSQNHQENNEVFNTDSPESVYISIEEPGEEIDGKTPNLQNLQRYRWEDPCRYTDTCSWDVIGWTASNLYI